MANRNRYQQMKDARMMDKVSDISNEAKTIIDALSDDEFSCLLSMRDKISTQQGPDALKAYDDFIILAF